MNGNRKLGWRDRLSIITLIALVSFVGAVRPLTRPSGRLYGSLGLTRMSLIAESPHDGDTPLSAPPANTRVLEPPLLAGVLLIVLKVQRRVMHAVPIRRLKLPPRHTSGAPVSD